MSRDEARELRRPARPPDLDAEQEVDLGRYAAAIAARWWVALLGLLAGVAVGYLLSLSGGDVYRAQALIHLGLPLSPGGTEQVTSLATNPLTADEIARQDAVVGQVSRASGLSKREIRAGLSVLPIATTSRSPQTPPLVNVSLKAGARTRVTKATNEMARILVARAGEYVDTKIKTFEQQLAQDNAELAVIDRRLAAADEALRDSSLTATDRLVVLSSLALAEQRRSVVREGKLDREQLILLARNIERSRIVDAAVAEKVSARSRRNSIVVGGAIGLLLGLAAALSWDRLAAMRHPG